MSMSRCSVAPVTTIQLRISELPEFIFSRAVRTLLNALGLHTLQRLVVQLLVHHKVAQAAGGQDAHPDVLWPRLDG